MLVNFNEKKHEKLSAIIDKQEKNSNLIILLN